MENQGEMFSDLALEKQHDNMIKALDTENKETIEEVSKTASKKHYIRTICSDGFYKSFEEGFIQGAKSEAAKNYWFKQFKQEINEL